MTTTIYYTDLAGRARCSACNALRNEDQPCGCGPTMTAELDVMAEWFGVNLRIEDATEEHPFAVWCEIDCDGTEDIIGTGQTAAEAVEVARGQLLEREVTP